MTPDPPGSAGPLGVDLDETLVDVNTFPLFVRWLPGRLLADRRPLAALRIVLALGLRKLLRRPHAEFKATVTELGGLVSDRHLQRWTDSLLRRRLNPEVLRLVRGWEGRTVLCTAAPEPYARVVGRTLGFDAVLASHLGPEGFVENVGPTKVAQLRTLGITSLGAAVTDDDALDEPMLSLARRRIVCVGGRLVET